MKMKKDATNLSSYKRKIYQRQGNVSVVEEKSEKDEEKDEEDSDDEEKE